MTATTSPAGPKQAPRYEHDCACCTFLGRFESNHGQDDLYFCLQGGNMPTVIARHSDDGSDYCSGLPVAGGRIECLNEAHRRAVEQGLLSS